MSITKKILVIEDDQELRAIICDIFAAEGYQVEGAEDGEAGLEKAAQWRPDLVILDLKLPRLTGLEVMDRLKQDPDLGNTPVIMLTAQKRPEDVIEGFRRKADDYIKKPFDYAELVERARAVLRRATELPFKEPEPGCTLTLSCEDRSLIGIKLSGAVDSRRRTLDPLHLDVATYARKGSNMLYSDWYFQSQEVGRQLHDELFLRHREVADAYSHARGEAKKWSNLRLRFEAPRAYLGVPLETLYDREDRHLALYHPLARVIDNITTRNRPLSPSFFNSLHKSGEELRVLLISSNTRHDSAGLPPIPGVDREIRLLDDFIKQTFEARGIATRVVTLPTEQATYEAVKRELRGCQYHIVHYAGHGIYDEDTPGNSVLLFWEQEGAGGEVRPVSAYELEKWLRDSSACFFYLSCCYGAATSGTIKLRDGNFLGIADSVVRAGVPAVLGYRWPVSDAGAARLAEEFYRSLGEQGQIDLALLRARNEVHTYDPADKAWLSPILVMQA